VAGSKQLVDFLKDALVWLSEHAGLTTGLIVASIVLLVASLWIGRAYLISVPADYFVRQHKPLESLRRKNPALWWAVMIGKNLLGALFIVAGLIMFVTPGQGILTLLMGLALTNFPGKQRLERMIIERPAVLKLVNGMRARAGKAPLHFLAE
jgi:amino acid transporter